MAFTRRSIYSLVAMSFFLLFSCDLLDVTSAIAEITPVTINFITEIRRTGESSLLVKGEVRVACIKTTGRPTRIPDVMRKALGSNR